MQISELRCCVRTDGHVFIWDWFISLSKWNSHIQHSMLIRRYFCTETRQNIFIFVMRSVTTQVWLLQKDKLWFQTRVLGHFHTFLWQPESVWHQSFVWLVRKLFSEVEKFCFKRFSSCELRSNSQLVWKQSILTHWGEPHYSIMHFSQLLKFLLQYTRGFGG